MNQLRPKQLQLTVSRHGSFFIFAGILSVVLWRTYVPPAQIVVDVVDQIDSLFPHYHLFPPFFETFLAADVTLPNSPIGASLNGLGLTEFDFGRLLFSIAPPDWAIALFFIISIGTLYITTFWVITNIHQAVGSLTGAPALSGPAIGSAAFLMALFTHSAAVTGAIIGANFFILGILYAHRKNRGWLALCCFFMAAIFGRFTLGAYFYLPIGLIITGIIAWMNPRSRYAIFIVGLGALMMLAADYRIFLSLLASDADFHRADWISASPFSLYNLIEAERWANALEFFWLFLINQNPHWHYQWNTKGLCYIILLACLGFFCLQRLRAGLGSLSWRTFTLQQKTSLLLIAFTGTLMGLLLVFSALLQAHVIDLQALFKKPFQFERSIVLLPVLSAFLMAASLSLILPNAHRQWITLPALALAGGFLIAPWLHSPLDRKLENRMAPARAPHATLEDVLRKPLYEAAKQALGPDWKTEITLSIAVPGLITAYNGFAHIDGYFQRYPLSYKDKFLKVIDPSFAAIGDTRTRYYTHWGNRLRVPIIGETADGQIKVKIDPCAVIALGASLIIAARRIAEPAAAGLRPIAEITAADQPGPGLWLYRPRFDGCPPAVDQIYRSEP